MKFGAVVIVHRGSPGNAPGTPGCERAVRGVLIGARGPDRRVRLLENDRLATQNYCTRAGNVGWWSASAIHVTSKET